MNCKRFCHFGKDKVFMDFVFWGNALNIKKMCVKMTNESIDRLIKTVLRAYSCFIKMLGTYKKSSKYRSLKKVNGFL